MSRFTHALCDMCWSFSEPGRTPLRMKYPDDERCCKCGEPTASGIYVREDPENCACKGNHDLIVLQERDDQQSA